MASDGRASRRFRAVRRQIGQRIKQPAAGLDAAHDALAYLSWLARHCRDFATLPSFLDAVCSDIVAILYACTVGFERSAYLHSRSLLENLLRHCYFDSRPSLFVTRGLGEEDAVRDRWSDLLAQVCDLPHFRAAARKKERRTARVGVSPAELDAGRAGSVVFDEIQAVYQESSRFVHGSTASYQSLYEGIESIGLDANQAEALGAFLQRLCERSILLLTLYHLGPYLLISQPIRRYMLIGMRSEARVKFLECLDKVPLEWARHQRKVAFATRRERRRTTVLTRDGLVLEPAGRVLIVNPDDDIR